MNKGDILGYTVVDNFSGTNETRFVNSLWFKTSPILKLALKKIAAWRVKKTKSILLTLIISLYLP